MVTALTIEDAQQRTEEFLTGQMLAALRTVEYEATSSCATCAARRTASTSSRPSATNC
jgi:hypothetical protein